MAKKAKKPKPKKPASEWARDWSQVFPRVEKRALEIWASHEEWALELCASRLPQTRQWMNQTLRLFMLTMRKLGQEVCLSAPNLRDRVQTDPCFRSLIEEQWGWEVARAAERQKTSPEGATSEDGIKRAGAVSKVHTPSPSPLSSRDWGKVFPYVPMAVLASTAAEAQWALELCADRFADPADAHDRFFRKFVRVMCELGGR